MKTLTVYTKPGCSYCANAKEYLKMIDVPFTEVDVSKDDAARNKIVLAGHKTLPVIYAGEQVLVPGGFTALKTMRKEDIMEKLHAT